MDRVTKSLVTDFLESYEVAPVNDAENFEKFSNYCVISHEYSETFEIDDIAVGETPGIDGIGIIVNGRVVNAVEEVEDLKKLNKYIEAKFIFIQSKTSDSFDGGEIGNFGHAILDLFKKKQALSHNEDVIRKIKIINYIYDKLSPTMTRGLPVCKFYFVTTGKWKEDKNLKSRFETIKQDLLETKYFSNVSGVPLGAQEIQKFYLATKMAISSEINFQHKVVIPKDMEGVEESYIGILPFEEFRKLIIDEIGNIKPIFYDNIRAFQGDNPVNESIQGTIQTEKVERFSVLNNGITIVAKGLTVVGNRAVIQDYQIVNGCQTSHVIYNNKDIHNLAKSLWIPVKIIVTKNEDVVNDIIRATNNQTAVKPEQLAALSQFQKDLENYYKTFKGDNELFYERRSKQYANQSSISKTRIITIPLQIKAFAAMFLGLPHKVSRYYGAIVKEIGGDIFSPEHQYISYYISSLAYYKLESFFRTGDVNAKYKKCRFHLLFAFLGIVAGYDAIPQLNSKKMDGYCVKLSEVLNGKKCLDKFIKTTEVIDTLSVDISNRDNFKIQKTTEDIRKLISIIKNLKKV